ncbi:MAG: response regulator transcription factor [Ignavibacteriae bacterium]|nr:response regulator transcription factor [Ignavibacteriota bacterium]
MKILIVDDNELMRQIIRGSVTQPGDEVVECSDGDEVLSAYQSFKADWVLMDISMRKTNGLKATKTLKQQFPNAHVAIVTQHNEREYRDEAKAAGAERYLLKDDLSSIRQSLLNNKSLGFDQE